MITPCKPTCSRKNDNVEYTQTQRGCVEAWNGELRCRTCGTVWRMGVILRHEPEKIGTQEGPEWPEVKPEDCGKGKDIFMGELVVTGADGVTRYEKDGVPVTERDRVGHKLKIVPLSEFKTVDEHPLGPIYLTEPFDGVVERGDPDEDDS